MSFRKPGILLVSIFFTACGHKEAGPLPRYAVVGFENLSGDASLDWVSRGAPEFLSRSLQAALSPKTGDGPFVGDETIERSGQALGTHSPHAPGESAARDSAIVAGANHIIAGYFERTAGGIRITASTEDVNSNKTIQTVSAIAASPFEALTVLAHQLSDQAGPAATNNPEAFRVYSTALEGTGVNAPPLLERAVALDPGFGRAWAGLAETYAALGNRGHASETIARARAQKLAPVDRARIEMEDASLRGDRPAVLAALQSLYKLSSGDTDTGRSLAEGETAAGNFRQAAAVWKQMTIDSPGDANAWNQLAYALCWSGDYAGALSAVREYSRLRPGEANPLDSQGDIQYWFGKYSDAAASYAAAFAKAPAFLNGGDLYKGAWATYRAGEKTAAETLFGKYAELREKAGDPSIVLFKGDWLYRTGRTKEAADLLRDAAKKAAPAMRPGIAAQLSIWDLLAHDRAAAAKDIAEGGNTGITPGDLLARFASMPTASAAEWQTRSVQVLAAPQSAGLRLTALGYALILDGKKEAAIPVWDDIVKHSAGTDFTSRNILSRLTGRPIENLAPPDSVSLNPFNSILDTLRS